MEAVSPTSPQASSLTRIRRASLPTTRLREDLFAIHRESYYGEIPLLSQIPIVDFPLSLLSDKEKEEIAGYEREVARKEGELQRLREVLSGLITEEETGLGRETTRVETANLLSDRVNKLNEDIQRETDCGEQCVKIRERTEDSLQLLKSRVILLNSSLSALQSHYLSATEGLKSLEIDTSTITSSLYSLQSSLRDLREVRNKKRSALREELVEGHVATNVALQQGNREAIRHLKTQKRIGRLKERLEGQRLKHMTIIMCDAVLLMANHKLSRKFQRLFTTFASEDTDEIIEKCKAIMVRETVHTDEAEDRLVENAKLMDTLKGLVDTVEALRGKGCGSDDSLPHIPSARLKRLSDFHPDLVTLTQPRKLKSTRQLLVRIVTPLAFFLRQFQALDPMQLLCVYPDLPTLPDTPSTVSSLLLALDKALLAALCSARQRVHIPDPPKKSNPLIQAMHLMVQKSLEKQAMAATQNRTKEYFTGHFVEPKIKTVKNATAGMLSSVVRLEEMAAERVRARIRRDSREKETLSLENLELETAAAEMRAYKLSKQTTLSKTARAVSSTHSSPPLSPVVDIRCIDKHFRQIIRSQKILKVPGKLESTELLFKLKMQKMHVIRSLQSSPEPVSPIKSIHSGNPSPNSRAQIYRRGQTMKRPQSPAGVSSQDSSFGGMAGSPRVGMVKRLRTLMGIDLG